MWLVHGHVIFCVGGRNEISPFRALTPSHRIRNSLTYQQRRNEISPFRALTPGSIRGRPRMTGGW